MSVPVKARSKGYLEVCLSLSYEFMHGYDFHVVDMNIHVKALSTLVWMKDLETA